MSETNFLRTLELGIQFGKWILSEPLTSCATHPAHRSDTTRHQKKLVFGIFLFTGEDVKAKASRFFIQTVSSLLLVCAGWKTLACHWTQP